MKRVNEEVKEEYSPVISYGGYSDDISLSTVSALVDSLGEAFKESLENLMPSLSEDKNIEQIKIGITLYTRNKESEEYNEKG